VNGGIGPLSLILGNRWRLVVGLRSGHFNP